MPESISHTTCPLCGERNPGLLPGCRKCGQRLGEFTELRERIQALERTAREALASENHLEAFRAYAILLEYRPRHTEDLKGICRSCFGLGAVEYGREILRELSGRIKNDPGINALVQLADGLGTEHVPSLPAAEAGQADAHAI